MAKLSQKEKEFLGLIYGGDIKKIEEYIISCNGEGYDILNSFPPRSNTPLGSAIYEARADIVSLLLQYGAECETPMYPSLTPLQAAILDFISERKKANRPEYKKIIELLLEHGADPTNSPKEKDSPINIAKEENLLSILPLLEEAIAKQRKAQKLESASIEQTELRHRGDKKVEVISVTIAPAQEKPQPRPSPQEPGYFQSIVNSVYSWFTDSDESSDGEDDNKPLLKSGKR